VLYFSKLFFCNCCSALFALPFPRKAYSINLPASVNQPTGQSSDKSWWNNYTLAIDLSPVKQVKLKQLLQGTSFQVYPCLVPRVCTQSSLFQSFGCFGAQNLKLLISLFVQTKEPSTLRSFSPIQDLSPLWRCWINTFSSWLCIVTRSESITEQFDSAVNHEVHAGLVK